MTALKNFMNFLRINNCLDLYLCNINEQYGYTLEEASLRAGKDLYDIINVTLRWAETPEKGEFWSMISAKWNSAVLKGEQFFPNCKSIW